GVRILRLIGPDNGIELVGLRNMWSRSGSSKAAIWKFVDVLQTAVTSEMDGRPGVEHQTFDTLLRQDIGRYAAGCAGADDEDVVFRFHFLLNRIPVHAQPARAPAAFGTGFRPLARVHGRVHHI